MSRRIAADGMQRSTPGTPAEAGHLRQLADRSRGTADQVLVATHAHGTAQLLLHCSTRASCNICLTSADR
jgi:hypothetical protein